MRNAQPTAERPPILVTPDEIENTETGNLHFAQSPPYFKAIREAGGRSTLMPVSPDPGEIQENYADASGILISGGLDVNPQLYNELPHPTTHTGSLENDEMGRQLIELARRDKKPLLTICRGMQLWNVVQGGTLYQHVPDVFGDKIDHLNTTKDPSVRHKIAVDGRSNFGKLILPGNVERRIIPSNTYHHQALNKLGQGLKEVAWAEDGVIEAVETTEPGWFAFGVQGHAETMDAKESLGKIIGAFIEAAQDFRKRNSYIQKPGDIELAA